tara:strand:+ start:6122 stop:6262 length:141 start_codon:yes stop_codon:yes gene_type:complete
MLFHNIMAIIVSGLLVGILLGLKMTGEIKDWKSLLSYLGLDNEIKK